MPFGACAPELCSSIPLSSDTLLIRAIKNGILEIVKNILDYGGLPDDRDLKKRTPLHIAIKLTYRYKYEPIPQIKPENKIEIVKLLIERSADVNACTESYKTALHFAVYSGWSEIIELLLTHGANIDSVEGKHGYSPLHLAVLASKLRGLEIVKLLLNHGANINLKAIHSCASTPLHFAIEMSYKALTMLLLSRNANVDAVDESGNTALHIACVPEELFEDQEVVVALLDYGADVNIACKQGRTALDYATYEYGATMMLTKTYDSATVRALIRHMALMKSQNLFVSKKIKDAINNNCAMNDYKEKCERDIAIMKKEKIVNTYVSFYDILVKETKKIAIYLKNYNVLKASKCNKNVKEMFPVYAGSIENAFKKGLERKALLDNADEIVNQIFPGLPSNCNNKIVGYLNDEDLEVLNPNQKPKAPENQLQESREQSWLLLDDECSPVDILDDINDFSECFCYLGGINGV